MTNRPNRGWRIRGNTARAVIKRKSDPLEITMALESQPNGKQSLTMKAEPMPGSSADPPKMANYEFAPGKGHAGIDLTKQSLSFTNTRLPPRRKGSPVAAKIQPDGFWILHPLRQNDIAGN